MQQDCIFILLVSFFLVLLMILMVSAIVSGIKTEKMFNQFIKEIENEIGYNKRVVVDIDDRGELKMKQITELKENEIFVFGSNLAGIHGAGAAKIAYRKFGAELRVGEGMTGRCYAIPTKDEKLRARPIEDIGHSILKFINTAKRRPDLTFLVTPIGCGLAGFSVEQIAPWFNEARVMKNVVLPPEFLMYIDSHVTVPYHT